MSNKQQLKLNQKYTTLGGDIVLIFSCILDTEREPSNIFLGKVVEVNSTHGLRSVSNVIAYDEYGKTINKESYDDIVIHIFVIDGDIVRLTRSFEEMPSKYLVSRTNREEVKLINIDNGCRFSDSNLFGFRKTDEHGADTYNITKYLEQYHNKYKVVDFSRKR